MTTNGKLKLKCPQRVPRAWAPPFLDHWGYVDCNRECSLLPLEPSMASISPEPHIASALRVAWRVVAWPGTAHSLCSGLDSNTDVMLLLGLAWV